MIAFSHLSEWYIIIFATMFKIMETLDGGQKSAAVMLSKVYAI